MAIDAAYKSTSFKDFNEQGNWGTVLDTGIGEVIGSIVGEMRKSLLFEAHKKL